MIYILTGNIRSGKTTALVDWSKNRENVDGLLCPDDDFGKRYFLKIKSRERLPLEIDTIDNEELIIVGNFRFLKSSFELANQYLIVCSVKNPSYLIIDELGKLELRNEGLHEAANVVVKNYESHNTSHLILVVRISLVDEVLTHYNIQNYQLISKNDLRENRFA